MRAFNVFGLVFPFQAKRLVWGTSLKWPILCGVAHKTTSQSTEESGGREERMRLMGHFP